MNKKLEKRKRIENKSDSNNVKILKETNADHKK